MATVGQWDGKRRVGIGEEGGHQGEGTMEEARWKLGSRLEGPKEMENGGLLKAKDRSGSRAGFVPPLVIPHSASTLRGTRSGS